MPGAEQFTSSLPLIQQPYEEGIIISYFASMEMKPYQGYATCTRMDGLETRCLTQMNLCTKVHAVFSTRTFN